MAETVFSTTLRALRKGKGVTQDQLAQHLGVSPQAVSKWENGSYPEGDLLPKLSEFFDVSISYLYGQDSEKKSMEQNILDYFQRIFDETDANHAKHYSHKEMLDKELDFIWAFQLSPWKANKDYYERKEYPDTQRMAALFSDGAGYSFMSLSEDTPFSCIVKEPPCGFAESLKITKEYRNLFKTLGEPGALEIVYYLLSLKGSEFVSASTVAKDLKLPEKDVLRIIDNLTLKDARNCFVKSFDLIKEDGSSEKAFGVEPSACCFMISLLTAAKIVIKPPFGYQNQIGLREESWFDKKIRKK